MRPTPQSPPAAATTAARTATPLLGLVAGVLALLLAVAAPAWAGPTPAGPVRPDPETVGRTVSLTRTALVARVQGQAADADSALVVVNKRRPLDPLGHVPGELRPVAGSDVLLRPAAADGLERLLAAAAADGVPMRPRSGYRSFETQAETYRRWVDVLGPAEADRQSARPGHSEHQTGLAVDVLPAAGACQDYGCFGATPEAAWVAEHAHRYGFVVRYQPGQEAVTGYAPEPWHLRWVGEAAAQDVRRSGARSLEAFLALPPAPTY